MKLNTNTGLPQPDPFVFEDEGRLYLYVACGDGVGVYESDDPLGAWSYHGLCTAFAKDAHDLWAPSVIRIDDTYYMYVSCTKGDCFEYMHVATAMSPLGPFSGEKCLYDHFSIDSHMVKTDAGLFLWYAKDNLESELVGTRIFVDRFLDPFTPENDPKEVLVPEFDEEKFTPQCTPQRNWYTLEGPTWFQEGDWQYLMYSAGCYQDDTYHIGYAVACSRESDLKKVEFKKVKKDGRFSPLIIKNEFEEGTGHHSVLKYNGEYYALYHGRDYDVAGKAKYTERRTARICRLTVADGVITAQRFEDHV